MNAVVRTNFAVKPVVAALAVAFAAVNAYAVTPNQMPGAGRVTNVSPGATVNGGGVGANIVNLVSAPDLVTPTITLGGAVNARAVIQWGGIAGTGETLNPAGFNIGASAILNFASTGGQLAAVLNIDASGAASQILGTLNASVPGPSNISVFVSNANGISVTGNARIIAPQGVGLLGADLTGATAKHDFVRNNTNNPFGPSSFIDITGGQSAVTIGPLASINGDAVFNVPAKYVLLAGGDITNMGSIFGSQVAVAAGMRAAPGKDTVNGVPNTTVNRLWNTEIGSGGSPVDGNLGTSAPHIEVALAGKNFVNTGSINSACPPSESVCSFPGYIGAAASGNISNGAAADPSQLVGLFAGNSKFGGSIVLDTFGAASKTELYNAVAGWETPSSLQTVNINQQTGAKGDVTINTITVGSNPSALTTTGPVNIAGDAVTISSTINHKLASAGGKQLANYELNISGSESVTVSAAVGAGGRVSIVSGGPLTISGNVLSDTDESGYGGIFVYNYGLQSGNTTTISGNLDTAKQSASDIDVINAGLASSKLKISGTLTSHVTADVNIASRGNLEFTGAINAARRARLSVGGTQASLQGPINADPTQVVGGSYISFAAPHASTKLYPAAVLTSPSVYLGWDYYNGVWSGTGGIVGVNATGAAYASAAQKPAAQIVTNTLVAHLLGNMNAPISGNTNFLLNSMPVKALDPTLPIWASIGAVGAGPQFINVAFTGDLIVDSGATVTPFSGIGLTTGFQSAGGLIGNGGSQMILQSSGALDIVSDSGAQGGSPDGGPGFNGFGFFEFPGGLVFKSVDPLTQFVPVYNAWTTVAQPFQGQFYESDSGIFALNYIATNGNSWGNWNRMPEGGTPTIYRIAQDPPTGVPQRFGFLPAPEAVHQNTYSLEVTGGAVNTCPITGIAGGCNWGPPNGVPTPAP